jgi:hypothetical protein
MAALIPHSEDNGRRGSPRNNEAHRRGGIEPSLTGVGDTRAPCGRVLCRSSNRGSPSS